MDTGFIDPRFDSDFDPTHYPSCDGRPAPQPDTDDRHERRCLRFLAAYYEVNRAQARILATSPPTPDDRTGLKAAIAALEELEDNHAAVGFFGDPLMDGVFYREIRFVRPELPRVEPRASTLSSHIAIPGLEDIPLSELTGPVTTTRWSHGETHP